MERWDDLRTFLAIARAGSLRKAAEAARIDHSTAYRRLAKLEESLGVRLFDRLRRGYVLTAEGETLLARAKRVEEEIAEARRELDSRDERLEGQVTLTVVSSFAFRLLPRHMPGFRALYPNIGLQIVVDQSLLRLGKREAEVAFRTRPGDEKTTVGRRVCRVGLGVYASREYIERRGRPRTPAELDGHDLVTTTEARSSMSTTRWLLSHAPNGRVVYRVDNFYAQRLAIRAGLGIGVVGTYESDDDPEMVRLFPPLSELGYELWLVTHKDLRHTARIRAVLDYFYDALQADRGLLEGLPQ